MVTYVKYCLFLRHSAFNQFDISLNYLFYSLYFPISLANQNFPQHPSIIFSIMNPLFKKLFELLISRILFFKSSYSLFKMACFYYKNSIPSFKFFLNIKKTMFFSDCLLILKFFKGTFSFYFLSYVNITHEKNIFHIYCNLSLWVYFA